MINYKIKHKAYGKNYQNGCIRICNLFLLEYYSDSSALYYISFNLVSDKYNEQKRSMAM